MSTDKEIRELFKRRDVALSQDDVWKVQSSWVVKHKALERLAAAMSIRFEQPTILRHERDEAVILVTGHLNDVSEWSIGEALVNANYRVSGKMAPYVYAMAEKRAKDRVILKLAGLHGVYSEDEADEFKEEAPAPRRGEKPIDESAVNIITDLLRDCQSQDAISELLRKNKQAMDALGPDAFKLLGERVKSRRAQLDQHKEAAE